MLNTALILLFFLQIYKTPTVWLKSAKILEFFSKLSFMYSKMGPQLFCCVLDRCSSTWDMWQQICRDVDFGAFVTVMQNSLYGMLWWRLTLDLKHVENGKLECEMVLASIVQNRICDSSWSLHQIGFKTETRSASGFWTVEKRKKRRKALMRKWAGAIGGWRKRALTVPSSSPVGKYRAMLSLLQKSHRAYRDAD